MTPERASSQAGSSSPLLRLVQVPPPLFLLLPSSPCAKAPLARFTPLGGSSTLGFLASRPRPRAVVRGWHKQHNDERTKTKTKGTTRTRRVTNNTSRDSSNDDGDGPAGDNSIVESGSSNARQRCPRTVSRQGSGAKSRRSRGAQRARSHSTISPDFATEPVGSTARA